MCLLLYLCRCSLALLFGLAVLSKLRPGADFRADVARYELLPSHWVGAVSRLVLAGEAAAALLLIAGGRWTLPGLALALTLLLGFCAALALALHREMRIPCGCFGSSDRPIGRVDLVRNLGFAGCALGGLIARLAEPSRSLQFAEIGVLTAVSALFVLLWTHLDEIYALAAPIHPGERPSRSS